MSSSTVVMNYGNINRTVAEEYLASIQAPAGMEEEFRKLRDMSLPLEEGWMSPPLDVVQPVFGKSMAQLMDEQDEKNELRHREQLALAQRLTEAAETSAAAANESDQSAQASLTIARKSLFWSRVANWLAFGALAIGALGVYIALR